MQPAGQNPITLSFADRELEQTYLAQYHQAILVQVRIALLVGAALYTLFSVLDVWIAPAQQQELAIIRFGFAVPWLLLVFCLSFRSGFQRNLQTWLGSAAGVGGLGIAAIVGVTDGMASAWFAVSLILVIIWSFTLSGLRFFNAFQVCVPLVVLNDAVSWGLSHPPLPLFINNNFQILSALVISMFAGYTIEWYARRDFLNARTIEAERLANERLLLNILPVAIAQRLKQQEATIADRFESIPILFADLVGFTPLSAQLNPIQLVELLNTLFSAFDLLTERYQLEKIKTIGDAYMVVGGLPNPHPDPVGAIAELALAMRTEVQHLAQRQNTKLAVRIGIHTGTVVAGVIGKKKFSYDIWGDAVNTASRMESHGQPDRIHITAATAALLQNRYDCQRRGQIEIKGKGLMETYWLRGKR
ncbi:MAG: adenylate/guanylate cyclase domain-containing protein [Spirulina sp. SIO3F2]|nr:adenylate/guanylate cyclase domain-containing protein [Spirulina sp. SIO3F2]